MTRDEKMVAIADVLLTAAAKAKELAGTGAKDGFLSRETALAVELERIAFEFKEMVKQRAGGAPV